MHLETERMQSSRRVDTCHKRATRASSGVIASGYVFPRAIGANIYFAPQEYEYAVLWAARATVKGETRAAEKVSIYYTVDLCGREWTSFSRAASNLLQLHA